MSSWIHSVGFMVQKGSIVSYVFHCALESYIIACMPNEHVFLISM